MSPATFLHFAPKLEEALSVTRVMEPDEKAYHLIPKSVFKGC
jgi:hypothetical protein